MLHQHGQKALKPGDFLVIGPECTFSLTDQPDGGSDMLVWIWHASPRCPECGVAPGEYRQWAIGTRLWRKLEQLHGLCREEVENPDKVTRLVLDQLHVALDIAVARLVRKKAQPAC